MATTVLYNGVTYSVPSFGDIGYAQGPGNLSQYLVALATATPTSGGTFTGNITFSPSTGGIVGTTTNNNAAAGIVGQYLESTFTSLAVPASNTRGDLATLTLTAGDWDLQGALYRQDNGAVYASVSTVMSIITAVGNDGTGEVAGNSIFSVDTTPPTFTIDNYTLPLIRVTSDGTNLTIAGVTTVGQIARLKFYPGIYTGGSPLVTGILRARRVR
jgi:hypothetical protein